MEKKTYLDHSKILGGPKMAHGTCVDYSCPFGMTRSANSNSISDFAKQATVSNYPHTNHPFRVLVHLPQPKYLWDYSKCNKI